MLNRSTAVPVAPTVLIRQSQLRPFGERLLTVILTLAVTWLFMGALILHGVRWVVTYSSRRPPEDLE